MVCFYSNLFFHQTRLSPRPHTFSGLFPQPHESLGQHSRDNWFR